MDEVLYEAARLIDASGHCKKTFETSRDTHVSYCIEGAIRKVLLGQVDISGYENVMALSPYLQKVARTINPLFADCAETIYNYNDAPERTPEECVKVLMEAAEIGD